MSARVVMLAGPGDSTTYVYNAVDRAIGVDKVIIEQPVPSTQLVRRRMEKLGPRVVAGQVLFKLLIEPALRKRAAGRLAEIRRDSGLDHRPVPEDKVIHVSSVNAAETIEHLRALAPSVVVVNGTRIIAKKVLQCIDATFLNMHAGITPLYRGVHGGYWALANEDRGNCGVSVHLVDPGIDTGGIVGQARVAPTGDDSFVTYPALQVAAGIPLMIDAVDAALRGDLKTTSGPEGRSRLWSHPTLTEYVRARLRTGTR